MPLSALRPLQLELQLEQSSAPRAVLAQALLPRTEGTLPEAPAAETLSEPKRPELQVEPQTELQDEEAERRIALDLDNKLEVPFLFGLPVVRQAELRLAQLQMVDARKTI